MPVREINLFFSYYFKDRDSYDRILDMLHNRGYFYYKNYSMTDKSEAQSEEYVKTLIRPRIDRSSVIVVLIGPGTSTRQWVNWEIEYGARNSKRIVGVYLWGLSDARLPRRLRELYDEGHSELALVRWNTESIVGAIRGENIWQE